MPSTQVMNHIHLDLPENLSAHPEHAPLRKWTVVERQPVMETYASFDRAWDGTEQFASMSDSGGNPALFRNFRYTLRVPLPDIDALESLLLQIVLLVDNRHCPDGQDHTPYLREMRFAELKYGAPLDKLLQRQDVEISLTARSAT